MRATEQTIMNNSRGPHGDQPRNLYPEVDRDRPWPNPYYPPPGMQPAPPLTSGPPTYQHLEPIPPQPYVERKPASEISHLSALYNPQALEQIYTPAPPAYPPEVSSSAAQAAVPKPPAYFGAPMQPSKFQKKVYFPLNTGINYIGLLIGPKGMYQKKLEEQTGCKILIRGKYLERASNRGTQKDRQNAQGDTEEDQHVLIIGESEQEVQRAEEVVKDIINANEVTRSAIRAQQLREAQEMNSTIYGTIDESLLTPYGPPSQNAYIIPVPNECVGLIIGKGGETIRQLQQESGAKIQVAKKEIQNTGVRNVFVDGPPERYELAKRLIENIVNEYKKTHSLAPDHLTLDFIIPNQSIGSLIGKGGETLKKLMAKTKAQIIIPRAADFPYPQRVIQIKGTKEQIDAAKKEIEDMIGIPIIETKPGFFPDPQMMPMFMPPPFFPGDPKKLTKDEEDSSREGEERKTPAPFYPYYDPQQFGYYPPGYPGEEKRHRDDGKEDRDKHRKRSRSKSRSHHRHRHHKEKGRDKHRVKSKDRERDRSRSRHSSRHRHHHKH